MSPGPAPRGARQPACPVSFLDAQTPSPGLAGRVAGLRPARARVRAETVGVPGFGDVMLVRLNLPSRAATSKLVAHELLKLDPAGRDAIENGRCPRAVCPSAAGAAQIIFYKYQFGTIQE